MLSMLMKWRREKDYAVSWLRESSPISKLLLSQRSLSQSVFDGIFIIKPQVQNKAWEESKEETEKSHIGVLEILYQSDYFFRRTINTTLLA